MKRFLALIWSYLLVTSVGSLVWFYTQFDEWDIFAYVVAYAPLAIWAAWTYWILDQIRHRELKRLNDVHVGQRIEFGNDIYIVTEYKRDPSTGDTNLVLERKRLHDVRN